MIAAMRLADCEACWADGLGGEGPSCSDPRADLDDAVEAWRAMAGEGE